MTSEEVLLKVRQIIASAAERDLSCIQPDTHLDALGLEGLEQVDLCLDLEIEFGITLEAAAILDCETWLSGPDVTPRSVASKVEELLKQEQH